MSDPQGQLSGLPVEESPLNQSSAAGEYADFLPDTSQCFEAWLENLKPSLEPKKNQPADPNVTPPAPGEIRFEGTLRVDGYAAGFLRSLTGTLIIGESGKVEADIIVANAIIDGLLRGNIHATESVVLGSHARVFGDIESPALSIQPGAVFEGQCHFLPSLYQADGEDRGRTSPSAPTATMPSSANSQSANEEADEEEAEPLAAAKSKFNRLNWSQDSVIESSVQAAQTMIDLRSDTVTKPTSAMRRAMAEAEVGDDVYGEDPTVNRLQERAAEIFDKEAAIFVPTGSMGNQTAVKLHTRPGQEVVIEERGHIYNFEMATMSAFSGALARPVKSNDGSGILTWDEIASAIHVNAAYYVAPTGLIALENSHNLAGGSVLTRDRTEDICARAHEKNLPVHLDGARIFNAAAALGETVADLARPADSVMFCLSKGLGAPVGSMLLGTRAFIDEARVVRKILGGGMRQAGVLAAAGLIALEESPKVLPEDHANAKLLAEGVAELPGIKIDPERVVTNIVMFDVTETGLTADGICAQLRERGVLAAGFGSSIRMVTHYDVSRADIEVALRELRNVLG
jgi:threonine aldolase